MRSVQTALLALACTVACTPLAACQNQAPPATAIDSSTGMVPVAVVSPAVVVVEDEPSTVEPGSEGDEPALPPGPPPRQEIGAQGVLGEVDRELSSMRATTYVHHSRIDESRGEFHYDCSGFVDYALGVSAPDAFTEIRQATNVQRPLAKHFVSFFQTLPPGAARGHWASISRAADLAPGDLVAWLKPPELSSRNTGHVMFVHGPVTPYQGRPDAFAVPIADSTHAPHGKSDPRTPAHASGLGTGVMVLLVDASGRPWGYKWSTWKKSPEYRTPIALGRVVR